MGTDVAVIEKKRNVLQGMMNQEFGSIKSTLPDFVDPKRFVNVALQAIVRQPELFDCTPTSIVQGIVQSAQLGLEIGGPLQHAHLVKFGGDAQLIVGYRGMIWLAKRSGAIERAVVRAVYPGEDFRVEFGHEDRILHTPRFDIDRSDDEKIEKVYVIFFLPDGSTQFDIMNRAEIEKTRSVAKAKNGPGWTKWWGEMAKKTVVKRGMKMIPLTAEVARAIEIDNRYDTGDVSAYLEGIDRETDVAEQVDAATAAKKEKLKEDLRKLQAKHQGEAEAGADADPESPRDREQEGSGATPPAEADPELSERKKLEHRLAAAMQEHNPDLLKDKKKRTAWIAEIIGDEEVTTVKACSDFQVNLLIGALKQGETEPLPDGGTPFDEEDAEQEEMPV